MAEFIEYRTGTGAKVLIQKADSQEFGTELAGADDVVEKATESFEGALSSIVGIVDGLHTTVDSILDPPDKMEVEFALGMSAGTSAFIAKAGIEASFKVTLSWDIGKCGADDRLRNLN